MDADPSDNSTRADGPPLGAPADVALPASAPAGTAPAGTMPADTAPADTTPASRALRRFPSRGAPAVARAAARRGWVPGDATWINLGQGQPETGPLPDAPPRPVGTLGASAEWGYGPPHGLPALRAAVAEHVNRLFRAHRSPYTAENVAIAAGGRVVLSRLFALLADGARVGFPIPDYTVYEADLFIHGRRLEPIAFRARAEDGFLLPAAEVEAAMAQGLDVFLASHPNNPAGGVWSPDDLARIVRAARRHDCLLVLDEFYSPYIYRSPGDGGTSPVSAAAHVADVDRDPVLLVDGLTKGFRLPGWRLAWAVGPRTWIEAMGLAAGAIDGGPPVPLQQAALEVLRPGRGEQELRAVQQAFARKRDIVLAALQRMGLSAAGSSAGTFYVLANLAGLPAALADGERFVEAALDARVLVLPGRAFDLDPFFGEATSSSAAAGGVPTGRSRSPSPLDGWIRLSYGPPAEAIVEGMERLEALVAAARHAELLAATAVEEAIS